MKTKTFNNVVDELQDYLERNFIHLEAVGDKLMITIADEYSFYIVDKEDVDIPETLPTVFEYRLVKTN